MLQGEIEKDLLLQGGSAVEDELQQGVPETLRDLSRAGVKVWMLTGDKVGTAKNIAAACHLLPASTAHTSTADLDTDAVRPLDAEAVPQLGEGAGGERGVLELTTETVPGLEDVPAADIAAATAAAAEFAQALQQARRSKALLPPSAPALFAQLRQRHSALELLSREVAMAAAALREEGGGARENLDALSFRPAAESGSEHVHGRASTGVRPGRHGLRLGFGGAHRRALAKHAPRPLHLVVDEKAIDWLCAVAPDDFGFVALRAKAVVACRCRQEQKAQLVRMVRAGGEGARVLAIGDGANDVDFAIGQFRFLRRLLLVHGRSNYRRMSLLVCYMFYKNVLDRFCQYALTSESGWSAQKYYSEVVTQLFNVIYTSLTIIFVAVADEDVPRFVAERVPVLYRAGVRQAVYTHALFWSWVLEALLVGGLLSRAVTEIFAEQFSRGLSAPSVLSLGIVCQSTIVTICTLRLALEVHAWTWPLLLVFAASLLAWVVSLFFFSSEWWGWVDEVLFSLPFLLFTVWGLTIGLLPKLCREVIGWLRPDTSRRTRYLRTARNQKHFGAETRTLLNSKPHEPQWALSDAEHGAAGKGAKLLLREANHGFAFSQHEPSSVLVSELITSTSPRAHSAESEAAKAAAPPL
ncbi:hypothetical protein T492DRAFT_844358 [Pavlovales sp. CCMP2436]|nr:hypothetical protein T492DRAFT_844358 [Pavlovales sp. CCMP2436]